MKSKMTFSFFIKISAVLKWSLFLLPVNKDNVCNLIKVRFGLREKRKTERNAPQRHFS